MLPSISGKHSPRATSSPSALHKAVEKSITSLATVDLAVLTTVTAIWSAIAAMACCMSSKVIGSRRDSLAMSLRPADFHIDVPPFVPPGTTARRNHCGRVVFLDDERSFLKAMIELIPAHDGSLDPAESRAKVSASLATRKAGCGGRIQRASQALECLRPFSEPSSNHPQIDELDRTLGDAIPIRVLVLLLKGLAQNSQAFESQGTV